MKKVKATKELVKVDAEKLARVVKHISKTGQTIKGFIGVAIDDRLEKENSLYEMQSR